MENFIFAFNGVLPIFLVMAIGCFLKYKNVLKEEFYSGASRFVFLVATPALLFTDTASVSFAEAFDVRFIITALTDMDKRTGKRCLNGIVHRAADRRIKLLF